MTDRVQQSANCAYSDLAELLIARGAAVWKHGSCPACERWSIITAVLPSDLAQIVNMYAKDLSIHDWTRDHGALWQPYALSSPKESA